MRIGRAATQLSDTVSGLEPDVRETLESVRSAADLVAAAAVAVAIVAMIGICAVVLISGDKR